MQLALGDANLISLAAGFVDQGSLPVEMAAGAIEALLQDPTEGRRALQYGTTIGDTDLRERLIAHLERTEGVPPGSFRHALPRTVVTCGSQQLLYLIAEALLDPGDIVLVESPTYFVFLGVLETRGARAVGIDTDEDGMRLDALESTLERLEAEGDLGRVKLIYTITEHANPTGVSLAADRRSGLVDLARRWSKINPIFILEDAAYRGLTFEGNAPGSVWRDDPDGDTVILARTFSKTFSPGLRTGYGILPEALLGPVLRLKGNHDFGTGNFTQRLLAQLLDNGGYDRHVASLIPIYRRKRDVMLSALEESMSTLGGAVTWVRPRGGLFLWLTFPEGLDTGPEGPLFARCREEGVIYVPGSYAFAGEPGPTPRNHARICFGVPSEAELEEGARRLATALADCLDLVA
jgi:2-aminoadipate transaminase